MSRILFILSYFLWCSQLQLASAQCMIEGPSSPCRYGQTIYMLNYVSGNGDSLVSSTWTLSPSKGIIQSSTKDKVTIEWNEDGTTLLQVKFITSSGDTFSCIKVIDIMNPHEFEVEIGLNRKCINSSQERDFHLCKGDQTFFSTDSLASYEYKWYLNNNPLVSKSHKTEDLTFNNLGIFILKLIASDTTNGCRCMVSLQDPCEVWDPLYEPAFVSIIELPQNPWHNYISRVMENTRHDHLVRTLCNPIVIPGGSNQRTSDKLADQFVMSISPNPVEGDDLVVDFESQNQNSITNISITDLNGKVLLITKLMGTRKVTINVASLNSGIYIIKALSNDQTLRTSKFIKL